jgi:hypothetical protein
LSSWEKTLPATITIGFAIEISKMGGAGLEPATSCL